jgi:molecular chaperone DnaK
MLAEFSEKITADMKGRIETALRETRGALAKRDAALATERAEALRKVLKEAGVAIYSQQPGAGVYSQTPYAKPEAGGQERVVDAQFRETK